MARISSKEDCVVCRQSGGLIQNLWEEICETNNLELWLIARPEPFIGIDVVDDLKLLLVKLSAFQ